MKYVYLFPVLVGFFACSPALKNQEKASVTEDSLQVKITQSIEEAAKDLETAVTGHNKTGVIDLLDPDYKEKEFQKLFKSHETFFLNVFFCGKVIKAVDEFQCIDFEEISGIQRVKIERSIGQPAKISYKVSSPVREIETAITLSLKADGVVGFIGSKGYTQVE